MPLGPQRRTSAVKHGKKLGFIAVRRLARLKTVLYGHTRSLYGILPCLTAPSRIILKGQEYHRRGKEVMSLACVWMLQICTTAWSGTLTAFRPLITGVMPRLP